MNHVKNLLVLLTIATSILLAGCGDQQEAWPKIVETRIANIPQISAPPRPTPAPPRVSLTGSLKGKTIIVDPGHGGKDPGAGEVGYSSVPEKTIVLDVAKRLQDKLREQGANVIMTRSTDRFIELDNRAVAADRYRADLLVSIHADSSPDYKISGATFYISENNRASYISRKIARSFNASFKAAGIETKGIRTANFRVLVKHSRPAVLVECGYLTNRNDAGRLNASWYQNKLAAAIADGITRSLARR